jgi:hypothetical protein
MIIRTETGLIQSIVTCYASYWDSINTQTSDSKVTLHEYAFQVPCTVLINCY